uniref:1,4-alpha-glucan branching enzyme n=1 Tax=Desulfatirhabdium butyrativorans TaxID=340467 RepID=A0A7C4MLN3_9BACT
MDRSTPEIARRDPLLHPFVPILNRRKSRYQRVKNRLVRQYGSLIASASAHLFYGLHRSDDGWVLREWAPHASAITMVGTFSDWQTLDRFRMVRLNDGGDWELRLPMDTLHHGDLYRVVIEWPGGRGDRIPAYATRVVQDPGTLIFNAQVWAPADPYVFRHGPMTDEVEGLFIYECHIGMAQEEKRIGTYQEFTRNVLPQVASSGYNAVQIMGIQEHPYYGSFGYQVSSFFAPSSRFGTPEEFKELVDTAHGLGLRVFMDIVHSHAVANDVEGLSRFDGTTDLYFKPGSAGWHPAWGTRCFDYRKEAVVRFLLSNCRYWMEVFQIDGFRFDGVTSMLYTHHGLGKTFSGYEPYFDDTVDESALCYLTLANDLVHEIRPNAVTIAEEVSGMPGLAASIDHGGYGFDYRFAMGVPDYWIRLVKDIPDEHWPMGHLWFELTNRRPEEKTISYAECHDQALVGDQTLIFRMIGSGMYDAMHVDSRNLLVDRGIALHKMIRLITMATAGNGYLTFMGNEFGHPEWIDFPREGNHWSFDHARRLWSLRDDPRLRYRFLDRFEREMLFLARTYRLFSTTVVRHRYDHETDKVLAFERNRIVFVFNFHPTQSWKDYPIAVVEPCYRLIFDTDSARFGGFDRLISDQIYLNVSSESRQPVIQLYLPARTALVLQPVDEG